LEYWKSPFLKIEKKQSMHQQDLSIVITCLKKMGARSMKRGIPV